MFLLHNVVIFQFYFQSALCELTSSHLTTSPILTSPNLASFELMLRNIFTFGSPPCLPYIFLRSEYDFSKLILSPWYFDLQIVLLNYLLAMLTWTSPNFNRALEYYFWLHLEQSENLVIHLTFINDSLSLPFTPLRAWIIHLTS